GGKSVHSRRPDSTATAGYQNMMRIRGYIKHWRYLLAMKVYRHCGVRVLRPAASGAGKGKSFAEAPALLRPAGRSRSRDDGEMEAQTGRRSEEHTSELQSRFDLVCRLLLEKK